MEPLVYIIIVVIFLFAVFYVVLTLKSDKEFYDECENTYNKFKCGMMVRCEKTGFEGKVIDINNDNKNGPGMGSVPYVVCKSADNVIKKFYRGEGLSIVQ